MTGEECGAEADALLSWLGHSGFAGYDPFDGLESPVFRALGLTRSTFARLAWIQLCKRSPVNLRRLVAVPPLRNPKTLGLVLTGLSQRARVRSAIEEELANTLVRWLWDQQVELGAWGYPFAWQNRVFYAPPHMPNAVCSSFVVHGLMDYGEQSGYDEPIELAQRAIPFFRDVLGRTVVGNEVCFSYTAADRTRIHNVNLLVASVLARLGRVGGCDELLSLATAALRYSTTRQRADGAWPYGEAESQRWIDGFHTGFNLTALRWLAELTGAPEATQARRSGFAFFQQRLLDDRGLPKYYEHSFYPVDAHNCAQAIVTLVESMDLDPDSLDVACKVADWTVDTLRLAPGQYAYRRTRFGLNRVVYTRWSQAWMFRALSALEAACARVSMTAHQPRNPRRAGRCRDRSGEEHETAHDPS